MKKLKIGDVVNVYGDQENRGDFEGTATLLEKQDEVPNEVFAGRVYEAWLIDFGDDCPVARLVSESDLKRKTK